LVTRGVPGKRKHKDYLPNKEAKTGVKVSPGRQRTEYHARKGGDGLISETLKKLNLKGKRTER